jgi:3-dehydro-L-gulonate-6-phosphate decarboxylase
VADLKIADAGEILAGLAFGAGADWTTVICAAPRATVAKVNDIARSRGGEVQMELFGKWDMADAREWLAMGVKQAIYHRGRDAQAAGQGWGQADLDAMKRLSDLGIELSVTGGVTADQVSVFKNIAVKCFIVGRGLYAGPDPRATARSFKAAIAAIW